MVPGLFKEIICLFVAIVHSTSSTISLADDILQLMSRQSWTKKDTCLTLMSTTILHTVNAHLPIRL